MDVHDEGLASDKAKAGTTPKQDNFLITFGPFHFAYVTFVLILSLFSTSAVVYTVACIYTGREVTFEKLMSTVPRSGTGSGLCSPSQAVLRKVVESDGRELSLVNRVAYEIVCLLLYSKLILFGLVIQTVIYLVCKSYYHEIIDKSVLSDHLEVYGGDYVPLKSDAEVE
ncbi:hypothetical protein FH972_015640 [Carpinus fangiana]|uniref:Uncharacterized protein n=1 Tax=Carpinus fangiana TaxID=176857 RepID=A0A5N6REJ5_9ROSI|nr:hypothetical protein FH972_015640 [Carpinus fangiana]